MDEQLIKTVNKLQDAFTTVGVQNPVDLPQITVIGSQSSGKSSVLENIVGRDFLPRGNGIVTRRPLVLQLVHRAATKPREGDTDTSADESVNGENPDEWGEFLHLPGQKFYDFGKIRDEISKDTDLKTGKNSGISPQPINLRIYSPKVLTLTMVDLPGLTKVPIGDQPKDIEKQIKEMLLKYITKPNSIILAVTAANIDLANSDGLKLAREVDPTGVRTIGVLTKVDLMDQGTDVVDILAGRIIPLRLGYVPIVNRGQRDIESKKTISKALDTEKRFFEDHPSYHSKAQYCGTPYLSKRLSLILMHQIKETLPEIKSKIQHALAKYTQELAQLGDNLGDGSGFQANLIINTITEFCTDFRTTIDGNSNELSSFELSGGARISFVFHELYATGVKSIDPLEQVKDEDIRIILYNSSGSAPALFVATTAFEVIIKKQIKRLEEPSLKCTSMVHDELVRILGQLLLKPIFKRFPNLREKFYQVVVAFFKKALDPTNKLVIDLVAMEACYINTGHPDFIGGHKAVAMVNEQMTSKQPNSEYQPSKMSNKPPSLPNHSNDENGNSFFASFFTGQKKSKKQMESMMDAPPPILKATGVLSDREITETEVIKFLIKSYFDIVKRTMIDMVPKTIMLKLVNHAKKELHSELLTEIYKKDVLDDLLQESDYTQQRRKECKKMIEALQKANEIVSSV